MRRRIVWVLVLALLLAGGLAWAQKAKVTFFWALYDGLTEDYRQSLQNAFMKANPDIDLEIVPIEWDVMHEKMTTSLAGGKPPELCIIGTRWLLDYMDTDAADEVTKYVSKATLDNIAPGAIEAKINGKLMGLPVAAGARILAINTDITTKVPKTMEEMRAEAKRIAQAAAGVRPDHAGQEAHRADRLLLLPLLRRRRLLRHERRRLLRQVHGQQPGRREGPAPSWWTWP